MKVFLCGPRKGTKNQWSKSFNLTETKVRVMGYGVFNPAWFRFDTSWSDDDITSYSEIDKLRRIINTANDITKLIDFYV